MEEYIDLGLPSGTLWKDNNEDGGFYGFDEAMAKFGRNYLPSKAQFEELKNFCKWEWTGNGYKVTGPNGKAIFMPAEGSQSNKANVYGIGLCGIYWSSTFNGYKDATELYFDSRKVATGNSDRKIYAHSIRLVTKHVSEVHISKKTLDVLKEQGWVDLGLASGTLWKRDNEKGGIFNDELYTYDEAIAKFGSYIPTKEQFEELKSSCQWEKVGNGYKVIGPNDEYIILNTTGYRYRSGSITGIYTDGRYWSSTPDDTDSIWSLHGEDLYESKSQWFQAVRLVIQSVEAQKSAEARRTKEAKRAKSRLYVDLGLPSGTAWKKDNEKDKAHKEGFYNFGEARTKFGNQLPTEEQYQELINFCQWEWLGDGYKVTGPNGKSIILPAAGGVDIFFYGRSGINTDGYYWSYTKGRLMYFSRSSQRTQPSGSSFRIPVRLVAKKLDQEHNADIIREMEEESRKFVDLGLASGTLWKKDNEKGGLCTFAIATARLRFENELPTKEQFEELKSSCQWKWAGDGYKVTGPNGKSIFMPAEGYHSLSSGLSHKGTQGCYWSSECIWVELFPASKTYTGGDDNYTLCFDSENVHINSKNRKDFLSLRMVRQSEEAKQAYETYKKEEARKEELLKYIDLGLPSGTLWKDSNEKGKFYSYKEVEEKFGNELPTKEQFEELQNLCKWTWIGNGYDVEGLNGNKIFMPADGSQNIYGSVFGSEANGNYWSSSPNMYGRFWILEFNSSKVNIDDNKGRNLEYSVRLIR